MGFKEDQFYAIEKLKVCAENIPEKLKKIEAGLFERLNKSKRTNLKKLEDIYAVMDKLSSHILKHATCKKGCSQCCYIRVDITDIEIRYIEKNQKLKRNEKIKQNTDGSGQPCPFLKDGDCTIYDDRPYVCRRHFFFTPDNTWCAHDLKDDNEFPLIRFSEIDKSYLKYAREGGNELYDIREVFGHQNNG